MNAFTPRELRLIAARVDTLTKARTANAALGVPTTPDVVVVDFPCGITAPVHWTPGVRPVDQRHRDFLTTATRHRDGYTVDLSRATRSTAPNPGDNTRTA